MKKRVLSILLALMMVVSMMSAMTVTSFADVQSQPVVTQEVQVKADSFADTIKNLIKKSNFNLKNYKLLVGVKNVTLGEDLKEDITEFKSLLRAARVTKNISADALRESFYKLYNDIDVDITNVVEFSTKFKPQASGTVVFSGDASAIKQGFLPVLVAEVNKPVYVKTYGRAVTSGDAAKVKKNGKLVSLTQLLPSGIRLDTKNVIECKECVVINGVQYTRDVTVYKFTMPNRMVTGYDFITLENAKSYLGDVFKYFSRFKKSK